MILIKDFQTVGTKSSIEINNSSISVLLFSTSSFKLFILSSLQIKTVFKFCYSGSFKIKQIRKYLLVYRFRVMINGDSWGHLYSIVRGEILGFIEDKLQLSKAFAKDVFINQERKLGDRRRLDRRSLNYKLCRPGI